MATKFTKWPQNLPNGHKIYQMATKFTKWPQNLPNSHKIDHTENNTYVYSTYQHLPLQDPTKFTQIGIFVLKKCHLATLLQNRFVHNLAPVFARTSTLSARSSGDPEARLRSRKQPRFYPEASFYDMSSHLGLKFGP
jgi:hypothetical protein